MTTRSAKSRLKNVLAATAAALIVLIAASQYARWVDAPARWQAKLAETADDDAAELLHEIAALGDSGLPLLADALGSSRSAVSLGAKQAIIAEMDRWELLSPREASRRLTLLAEALAARAAGYDTSARIVASDLAVRLLIWPLPVEFRSDAELTEACQRVLQANALPLAAAASSQVARSTGPGLTRLKQPRPLATNVEPHDLQFPPLPPMLAATPAPEVFAANEPARLAPPGDAKPLPVPGDTTGQPVIVAGGPGIATGGNEAVLTSNGPNAQTLHGRNASEVFALWHSPLPEKKAAAEMEFQRRQFNARQVEVGKGLTDPDAQVRRHWAETLPGLSGIDAKPWLLWLSNDADAGVRSAVLTIMATSGDLAMTKRAAQMARDDADPSVRELGARLLEEQ